MLEYKDGYGDEDTMLEYLNKDTIVPKLLYIKNNFNDDEIEFLDKLCDKEKKLIPGKTDEYLKNITIIGLNNSTKSSIHELETELNDNPYKNIQSTLGALKRNLNINTDD